MGWQASEALVDAALVGGTAAGGAAAFAAAWSMARGPRPGDLAATESERRAILDTLGRRAAAERR